MIRSSLIYLSLIMLSACGFSPMYGTENANALAVGVRIEAPDGRLGHALKEQLEDKLNPPGGVPANPTYKLHVTLSQKASPIGVARDGTVARYNVEMNSVYQLTRLSDGKLLKQGDVRHVSSYNNLARAYFSTFISERDALDRGVVELSELYRQRITSVLAEGVQP